MPLLQINDDAMSSVLDLVRMRGEMVCLADLSAPWGLRFDKPIAHFHIVERGAAWLRVNGTTTDIRLATGDLVIVPLGAGHTISDRQGGRAILISEAIKKGGGDGSHVLRFGGGGTTANLVCGQFRFEGVLARQLLDVLPPSIHVARREGDTSAWIAITSRFLIDETRNPRPGSAIMIARLIDLLFVQALRDWGAARPANLSWMSGLSDPQVGRALSAIHAEPGRNWSVAELASASGMSRSTFAERFSKLVGKPPLRYLAEWRISVAADLLQASTETVTEIARRVGYESEAAFTRAFKARFGSPPSAYRKT